MRAHTALRVTSWLVLLTFTSLTMQPLSAAMQIEQNKRSLEQRGPFGAEAGPAAAKRTPSEKYAAALGSLETEVRVTHAKRFAAGSESDKNVYLSYKRALQSLDAEIEDQLAATERHLIDWNIAPAIRERHAEVVRKFRQDHAELLAALDAASNGGAETKAEMTTSLSRFFEAHNISGGKRGSLNPNSLPWRTPKSAVRKPIVSASDFAKRFAASGTKSPRLAKKSQAKETPSLDDLAETEDVQLSASIRAKATQLGNDPVAIYNFVHNNVRYVPSYGSVQGAQDTLDKLSGNDFDTASLLIALYRAAGIPARYAYGTIELPAAQVMNWLGGVAKIEAAQEILGQGGVPNISRTSAGTVNTIQLEHIWVEAWVSNVPSRGARNLGSGDTWIPVDASFKQFTYTQGLNLQAAVPFDSNAFIAGVQQGATVNLAEGSVQNLNQASIHSSIATYQSQLQSYADSVKPGATLGDILGTQTAVPTTSRLLTGTLPYKVVAKGPVYSELPVSLRHQFQYSLYADDARRDADDPIWTFQRSLPALAGKKVTLSFKPASPADAQLIASYMPQPHADGSPIQASEFPKEIPPYANLISELKVDGETVASGGSFTIGSQLAGQGGFTQYDFSGWDLTLDDTLVAGQMSALGLSIQGISNSQLQSLATRMKGTQAALEGGGLGVDVDQVTGDLLTGSIWSYFATLQNHGSLAEKQLGMIDLPAFSYGFFHLIAQPDKLFGTVVTGVRYPGLRMDIGHLRHARWAKDNNVQEWIRYNRMRGQFASFLEHFIPENFFVDRTACNGPNPVNPDPTKPSCPEAVSAVKAIADAGTQGQKIFVITQANQNTIDSLGLSSTTLDDIRNAVAAGKEVTVHQSNTTIGDWTGAGYAIVDPQTGAGAYLIEGGSNGSDFLLGISSGVLSVFGLFALFGGLGVFAAILAAIMLILIAVLIAQIVYDGSTTGCFIGGFGLGVGAYLGGLTAPQVVAVLAGLIAAFTMGWTLETTPYRECVS